MDVSGLEATAQRATSVLRTDDAHDLDVVGTAGYQAVVHIAPRLPDWMSELAAAVESGAFQVPRTVVAGVTRERVAGWLHRHLPERPVPTSVRSALIEDVLALFDRLGHATGATRVVLRMFTGAPDRRCGFHVDTVPPGAPPWGFVRVYNGAGTNYVDPANVRAMRDVYRYVGRRERLWRLADEAARSGNSTGSDELLGEIIKLDAARPFLHRPAEVKTVPARSIIAFRHLDVRLHGSDHEPALAWIHCSPMEGDPRLVVNVSAFASETRQSHPRDTDGSAR